MRVPISRASCVSARTTFISLPIFLSICVSSFPLLMILLYYIADIYSIGNIHKYSGHILLNMYIADILFKWYTYIKEAVRMAYTEAQKKASIKYMTEKTDDIRLRVPKGLKDKYKAEAQKRGISMTQFIINCVEIGRAHV